MTAVTDKCIAIAAGPSECGKSVALWDFFISQAPRRISIDPNGEMSRRNDKVITTYSWDELLEALDYCKDWGEWHIAIAASHKQMAEISEELALLLNPEKQSDEHRSYALEVGGVMIDCPEISYFAPNQRGGPLSANLEYFVRGRHNGIKMAVGVGYPADVSRLVTNSANHLLVFGTTEKNAVNFWAGRTSPAIGELIASLPPYELVWIEQDVNPRRITHLSKDRAVLRVVDYAGRDYAAASPAAAAPQAPADPSPSPEVTV